MRGGFVCVCVCMRCRGCCGVRAVHGLVGKSTARGSQPLFAETLVGVEGVGVGRILVQGASMGIHRYGVFAKCVFAICVCYVCLLFVCV